MRVSPSLFLIVALDAQLQKMVKIKGATEKIC